MEEYITSLPKGIKCIRCQHEIKGHWGMAPTLQQTSYTCVRCGNKYGPLCDNCGQKVCPQCGGKLKSESAILYERGWK